MGSLESSNQNSLQFLSVNSFGAVMGLLGLSFAWRLSHHLFGTSSLISELIGFLGILIFVLLCIMYTIKLVKYPKVVLSEFSNPIAGNFFGAVTVAILLLSAFISSYSQILGQSLWIIGTCLTLLLSYFLVSRLFKAKQDLLHAVPAMLIPVVATLNVPVTSVIMPFAWVHELNMFCFAIGGISALIFITIIIARLIHHEPMAAAMAPSLLILIAPFEVGFLAYVDTTHSVDLVASILFYFGLFLLMVLFPKASHKSIPFGTAWWALSFPMAALSSASLKYALLVSSGPLKVLSALILILVTFFIAVILIRTIRYLISGKLLRG
ncbi:SLAC1 anion channel family protein [Paenibacillus sp. CF384]|uniref:SLAC1 anion channel family protein n=1 Tax=Paenibacillus sp. CF384 TaxID=1884382 RepID=UPI002109AB59|nr:SLAC1 anion channel family protein [Paenibacillus sp. CF384]